MADSPRKSASASTNSANLPLFSENQGAVDYQMRMSFSPLTFAVIAICVFVDLPWKWPFGMMVPYLLGRVLTVFCRKIETQVLCPGPLLGIGYGWARLVYSAQPFNAAVGFVMFFYTLWLLLFAVTKTSLLSPVLANDMAQVIPWTVACCASWFSCWERGAWLWFVGLCWGMFGPLVIPMLGFDPWKGARLRSWQSGPMLWYSDASVTIALVFSGMLQAALKPDMLGSVHCAELWKVLMLVAALGAIGVVRVAYEYWAARTDSTNCGGHPLLDSDGPGCGKAEDE